MFSNFEISSSECITCTNEILKKIGTLQGVFGAEVDRINGQIIVSHTDEVTRDQLSDLLCTFGICKEQNKLSSDEPSIWGCTL